MNKYSLIERRRPGVQTCAVRFAGAFIVLSALLCLTACGKKGPLKAPEDVLPGVKAGISTSEGVVSIKGSADEGVSKLRIERVHGKIGDKKETGKGIIHEGEGKSFSVKDADIKAGEWYVYKIIPLLSKNKTGSVFVSEPVNVYLIPAPPVNLGYEILQNKGSIVLRYEGKGCDEYRIFRQVGDAPKSEKPYAATKEHVFTDEFPLLNTELTYEVRCVTRGMESGNNPTVKLFFQ